MWSEQQGKLAHLRSFDARGQVTTWEMENETPRCQESAASDFPCELDLADSPTPSLTRFGFGWHSAWRSATTGLVQMRQRWYSPKLGQFLSHDPLEYLDSHNLYAFGARDPVNGWDPMGLGTQGFANELLDGVGRGAKKEYNRHVEEMSKSFDSMADTAKELKENWRFAFDLDVWKDTALDSGATVKELTKETLKEGQECAANAGRCLAESAIAKEARGLAEDIRRGDGGALGERVGKVGVNISVEGAKAQVTRGGGRLSRRSLED